MDRSRRSALRLLAQGLVLGAGSARLSPLLAAVAKRSPAALLVPLTGDQARIGLSMQRAALLAEKDTRMIRVVDSAGRGGAAAAARAVVRGGARLILGPVFSAEVRPVVAAVGGRAPVIAFSNDPALADSGAFLLGLNPSQLVTALLSYARGRGIRAVAVAPVSTAWGRQAAAAAARAAPALGIALGGTQADALLVTENVGLAQPRQAGEQLLVATEALSARPADIAGAWCVAPDPQAFGRFAAEYETANGGSAGLLAGLAYDAALMAAQLAAGPPTRAAILAGAFSGATGGWRFRADGTAERTLAILLAGADGYEQVDTAKGA